MQGEKGSEALGTAGVGLNTLNLSTKASPNAG